MAAVSVTVVPVCSRRRDLVGFSLVDGHAHGDSEAAGAVDRRPLPALDIAQQGNVMVTVLSPSQPAPLTASLSTWSEGAGMASRMRVARSLEGASGEGDHPLMTWLRTTPKIVRSTPETMATMKALDLYQGLASSGTYPCGGRPQDSGCAAMQGPPRAATDAAVDRNCTALGRSNCS